MLVLDSGALLAVEKGDRRVLNWMDDAKQRALPTLLPAPVLAQVWRGGPQPLLSRALKECAVVPLGEALARQVGRALADSGTRDVVDASVVVVAATSPDATVVTSDPSDIGRIADGCRIRLRLLVV
jgi:predicted nucleic acid-binding protein